MSREASLTILGIAQDGGRPQPGCFRDCCIAPHSDPRLVRHPVSLGIIGTDDSTHLIEASREMAWQFRLWSEVDSSEGPLDSIWITHAHHGHVDGLGLFGKEAMNAKGLRLHCSERFADLIEKTPSWSAMVHAGVLEPTSWTDGLPIVLGDSGLTMTPISVPHRDELSDMHSLLISGPGRSVLFLPDHDDWSETLAHVGAADIRGWLSMIGADIALLDGTFWSMDELQHRHQSHVPHPCVSETLERLGPRREDDPEVLFLHLNHTNPLHDQEGPEYAEVLSLGWAVAEEGMRFTL